MFLLITAALAAACSTLDPRHLSASEQRQPRCSDKFAACAPPASYEATVDASRLELRKQIQLALRMDVPENVSSDAAALVLRRAEKADVPALLELASLYEDEWAILGKCQCKGEENQWDKKRIGAVLAKRLPSAELRSPKLWEDRMAAPLAAIRDLKHQMAMRGLSGGATDDLEAAQRKADLELCEAVHGARTYLLPDTYRDTALAVHRRRDQEAGPAAGEFAATAIQIHEKAKGCTLAAAPAPPKQAAPSTAAPDDEDEDR